MAAVDIINRNSNLDEKTVEELRQPLPGVLVIKIS